MYLAEDRLDVALKRDKTSKELMEQYENNAPC